MTRLTAEQRRKRQRRLDNGHDRHTLHDAIEADYTELRKIARFNLLMEDGAQPFDHAAAYLSDTRNTEALADMAYALIAAEVGLTVVRDDPKYGWPDTGQHSVKT